ncbi:MAG: preprotein translocase subunit SecG [Planctomycetota bacterium]
MYTLKVVLIVLFVIDAILLIIAVLLQSGRGGGLAGALGGIGGAESALGVRAASQIEKATGVMAAIFLLLALTIAWLPVSGGGEDAAVPEQDRAVIEPTPAEEPEAGAEEEEETAPESKAEKDNDAE